MRTAAGELAGGQPAALGTGGMGGGETRGYYTNAREGARVRAARVAYPCLCNSRPGGPGPKRSGCTLSPLNANQEESTPDATTELCRAAKLHPGVPRGRAAVPPGPGGADEGQPARAAGADHAGHGGQPGAGELARAQARGPG